MPVIETVDTNTDPVPNTDLPKPESALNQENISLYGHLFLAAISDGEDIKKALNPEEKLDTGTFELMRGKRLATSEVERKYNPVLNGLSIHERTEKWKGKSYQEAYSQWSSGLLNTINQSESQERKELISKFFNKDISEIKAEDIKNLYDRYCKDGSNIDGFVKKAIESESSSIEVEWLAKKLFGTKSGETVRKIYEIEADLKNAGNIDNAIKKANEIFWAKGLDRFNNPNKEEEDLLGLIFTHFKEPQKEKDSTEAPSSTSPEKTEQEGEDEGAPQSEHMESDEKPTDIPTPFVTSEPGEPKLEDKDEDIEGAPPPIPTEELDKTTDVISTVEPSTPNQSSITNEPEPIESIKRETDAEGAPPPAAVVEKSTPEESSNPVTEAEPIESTEKPEPTPQAETVEAIDHAMQITENETVEPEKLEQPPIIEPPINTPEPSIPVQPETIEPNPQNQTTSMLQSIINRLKR